MTARKANPRRDRLPVEVGEVRIRRMSVDPDGLKPDAHRVLYPDGTGISPLEHERRRRRRMRNL